MSIRVVLVDDHPVVREGLRELLQNEADMEVIGEADNGRTAIALAEELKPDVMVLDVAMPELNGVGAVKRIRALSDSIKVLALSMHSSEQIVSDMMAAGAAGYVTKGSPLHEVIRAIRAVQAGEIYIAPEIAGLPDAVLHHPDLLEHSPPASVLSDREKEVLQLVAEGHSSKEVASRLFVSAKTVEFHRKSIMDKLSLRTVAQLTKYAIREGLTPPEP